MSKKPTVVYFLSGTPTWSVDDCSKINQTTPFRDDNRSRTNMEVIEIYKNVLSSSKIMTDMTFLHTQNKSLHELYGGLAPMGQSVQGLLGKLVKVVQQYFLGLYDLKIYFINARV
jgi:hypothetical protein